MKCFYCNGPMERGATSFRIENEHYELLIRAVPAWVCTVCGQAEFSAEDAQAVQEAVEALNRRMPLQEDARRSIAV